MISKWTWHSSFDTKLWSTRPEVAFWYWETVLFCLHLCFLVLVSYSLVIKWLMVQNKWINKKMFAKLNVLFFIFFYIYRFFSRIRIFERLSIKETFRTFYCSWINFHKGFTPADNYICSKLTIETLEQGVKYVQS